MTAVAHIICPASELPPGGRKIVEIEGRSVGVFNLGGELHALKNVCPHRYAPLCAGPLTGLVTGDQPGPPVLERAGEVVRCPWHGWEFDIRTGFSVFNPHRVRAKTYPACFEPAPSGEMRCGEGMGAQSVETYTVRVHEQNVVVYL